MFPTIAEYNQAIQSASAGTFNSLKNLSFIPSRTIPVRIYSYGAGSYAVVFKAKDQFNEFAIRCFISAEQENIERYRNIDNYLKGVSASWITKIELLQNEIKVKGSHYPVIKMDWIEGQLLNNHITQNINNNSALTALQKEIVSVSKSLESFKIGHGDIQCGNVIIVKNVNGENVIKLIDYDGMYIPLFSNKTNLERGRTEFQHPKRSQIQYNEKIDRFSFWVILCAIEALKFDKTLWLEVMQGGFNTLDNLLFLGDDFQNFNNSKLVNRLYALRKTSLNFYLDKLNKFCHSSAESVECPLLFDFTENDNDIPVAQPGINVNNNSEIQIITNPIGAAVLTSTFQRIGTTPLKLAKEKYLDKTLIVSYGTQFKQISISQSQTIIDLTFSEPNHFKIVNNDTIPPPFQPTQPITPPKSNISGYIISGVIALIIILILIVASRMQKPSDNFNSNSEQPTTNADTAVIADSVMPTQITLDNNPAVKVDTAKNIPVINNDSNISETDEDDQGFTAEQAVTVFLGALSKNDCEGAWGISYNPTWENNGRDWFCSSGQFGGITQLTLGSIYPISKSFNKAEIHVDYYAEDMNKGNQCFNQKISVKKITFDNNTIRWMITGMKNIQPPFDCKI